MKELTVRLSFPLSVFPSVLFRLPEYDVSTRVNTGYKGLEKSLPTSYSKNGYHSFLLSKWKSTSKYSFPHSRGMGRKRVVSPELSTHRVFDILVHIRCTQGVRRTSSQGGTSRRREGLLKLVLSLIESTLSGDSRPSNNGVMSERIRLIMSLTFVFTLNECCFWFLLTVTDSSPRSSTLLLIV